MASRSARYQLAHSSTESRSSVGLSTTLENEAIASDRPHFRALPTGAGAMSWTVLDASQARRIVDRRDGQTREFGLFGPTEPLTHSASFPTCCTESILPAAKAQGEDSRHARKPSSFAVRRHDIFRTADWVRLVVSGVQRLDTPRPPVPCGMAGRPADHRWYRT